MRSFRFHVHASVHLEKRSAASICCILLNFNGIEGGRPLLLPRVTVYAREMSGTRRKGCAKGSRGHGVVGIFPIHRERECRLVSYLPLPLLPSVANEMSATRTREPGGTSRRKSRGATNHFSSREPRSRSSTFRFLTFARSRLFRPKGFANIHRWNNDRQSDIAALSSRI